MEFEEYECEKIIQNKCKKFVKVQEVQKNTSSILAQINERMVKQINKEEKNLDVLKLEAEKISTQEIRSREEIVQLEQFVANAGEIKVKLKEYTTTLAFKVKNLNTGLEETLKKVLSQNENFEKNINASVSNIQHLKKSLEDERNSRSQNDDSIKKENMRLKQILLDKKEYLKTLKARFEEKKKQQEVNCKLIEEREKLKDKLKETKMKLTEIQNKTKQAVVDRNFILNSLQQECETRMQRIVSLENEVAHTNEKNAETVINIQKLEEAIHEERLKFDDINAKNNDIKKYIAEMETKLNSGEHNNSIDNIKSRIVSAQDTLVALSIENSENMKLEEQLIQTYTSRMEEKNSLIIEKEAALNKIEVIDVKNQLLDQKIVTAKLQIQEARDKLNNISSEPYLLELETNKRKLDTYKQNNEKNVRVLEIKKNKAQITVKELREQVEAIKIKIKETQEFNSIPSLSGILKKDNQQRKYTSPKMVQFLNVVSSEESNDESYSSEQKALLDKICADYDKVEENKNKKNFVD